MKKHSSIKKFGYFQIIQDLDKDKYPEFAKKIIKTFDPNISSSLSDTIIQ